ncbi:hypothetical protein PYW07_008277 [Mythimna separata]|uniref:Peptidase S1 domain-containing protein n=1 Tax=Mythimna separata TaxID=271217 RepID=A0AAD7YDH1_MYTSE|nr:hypothetical protein PYW07_008277 [Mythimna separata]
MFKKSSLFLFVLSILQVYARYKNVEPDLIENEINAGPADVSSSVSRIELGWEAYPGQHPHHAALRSVNSAGNVFTCGASVIAKEWVVTAASCIVHRIFIVVRAGVVSLLHPEYVFETTKCYTHPLFIKSVTSRQPNNIGLVALERPVVYTRLLKPIRIQSSADAFKNYNGEQVYISGHGRTRTNGPISDVLRWVYLRAISNASCRSSYPNAIAIDTTICAQFYNVTGQSIGHNDEGGPLVHVGSDGIPTLIGVISFIQRNFAQMGKPIVFTRPGPFLSWFTEITGIDFENLQEEI